MTEDFAWYHELPKYVVSSTPTIEDLVDDWGPTTILRSVDEVARLKVTEGGPIIVHGSATLGHALADAGLVDRYHLLAFPLLLGAGKRLFGTADTDAVSLDLAEHEAYGDGVRKMIFDVARPERN